MAVSEHSICSVMLLTGLLSLGSTTHPLLLNGITARSSSHTVVHCKGPCSMERGGKKSSFFPSLFSLAFSPFQVQLNLQMWVTPESVCIRLVDALCD